MKLIGTLGALLGAVGVDIASAQSVSTHPCPAAGQSSTLPILPGPDSTPVRLPIVSEPSGLCILLRRSSADGSKRAAVVRSYSGRSWERSPGLFSKVSNGVDIVDCSAGTEHECDVTLPPLDEGQEYVLESYEHTLGSMEEASRFLEQATFGPTLDDVQSLAGSGNDFESWVRSQIEDYDGPLTKSTLRKFYRRHTNPKFEFPYNTGAVSSLPCELHSRWRTYAISSRDCLQERKTGRQKHLVLKSVSGVGYVWYVDGHVRTVTSGRPTFGWGNNLQLKLNFRYRIGTTNGANWRSDCVG